MTHRSTEHAAEFWKHIANDRLGEPALPITNAYSWPAVVACSRVSLIDPTRTFVTGQLPRNEIAEPSHYPFLLS